MEKIKKLKRTSSGRCRSKGAPASNRKRKLPPTEAGDSDAVVVENDTDDREDVASGSALEEDIVDPVLDDEAPCRGSPLPP